LRTDGFENADSISVLKNEDEETRDHIEPGDSDNQHDDDQNILVEEGKPPENLGLEIADVADTNHVILRREASGDDGDETIGHGIHIIEIGEENLVARNCARLPTIKLDKVAHIDIRKALVELIKMGIEDAADGETTSADTLGIDEKHAHRITQIELQKLRKGVRKNDLIGLGTIGERKDTALDKARRDKRPTKRGIDPLEGYALKGIIGLDDTRLRDERLNGTDARNLGDSLDKRGIVGKRRRLKRTIEIKACKLNMRTEADNLVTNLALETQPDGHGDNHNNHAESHGSRGDTDSRA